VFNARKAVCAKVGESRYEPAFGEEFADHFVDPRDIGNTIKPNPYFPVIAGATREFRGSFKNDEGETVRAPKTSQEMSGTAARLRGISTRSKVTIRRRQSSPTWRVRGKQAGISRSRVC
jgi:hypothetical protein